MFFEAQWLKEQLDMNGLKCVLTHTRAPRILEETQQVCGEHKVLGCKYIGLGSYPFDPEKDGQDYPRFLRDFLPAARVMKENDLYFMYHNHDREFPKLDDQLIMEKLLADIPADLMGFTLDTFWVQAGGGDPAQWLEKLAGRIPCIHLKDYAYGRKMAPVGEGNINFDRVFEKAEAGGCKYMLVEQDDCNGEDPFDCLRRSYEYLKSRGFE